MYVFSACDKCWTTNFTYIPSSQTSYTQKECLFLLRGCYVDVEWIEKTILFIQYATFERRLMLLIECLILYTFVLYLFSLATFPSSIFIDIRCFVMMSIRHWLSMACRTANLQGAKSFSSESLRRTRIFLLVACLIGIIPSSPFSHCPVLSLSRDFGGRWEILYTRISPECYRDDRRWDNRET